MKGFFIVCLFLAALPGYSGEPPSLADVAYRTGMPEPKLDFYAPEGKGFPTLVHVYGSGWRSGSGKSSAPVAEALRRNGVGCVLVSHRLAPAHSIREQAGDVAAAFAWARGHVAEKGGDPRRIFLSGHSTGGQLVLLVATEPTYLAAEHLSVDDVAGVIGLSAPTDLLPRADGHGYGNIMSGPRGKGVFPSDLDEIRRLSPLHQLNRKIPRTLLLIGSDDFPMLAADARHFTEKAKVMGTDTSTDVISGKDHMGMIRALTNEEDPVFLRVVAFIQAQPK
ncbi:MAG: alpha/beta hydrolase [Limisphaerales bacterium]